ncbi:MAG: hypothetical protein SF182_09920 [Deltaproteobacteria bacterium]|nr:hypothetical protein [Deltaproteobacteria bacterium]
MATLLLVALGVAGWMALRWPMPEWMLADNDWVHQLNGANQILYGEHPFIDWHTDYGPLRYYPSALAQWLLGARTLSELLLVTAAYALSYTLLFRMMWIASGRRLVAAGLLVVALIVAPRLFKYYTTLGPVLCLWLAWRYIASGTRAALASLAAGVVFTGLFRFDFGAFAGLAALVAVASAPGGWGPRLRRSAELIAWGILWVTPWIGWLVVRRSLASYLIDTLLVAPGHASAMALPFPRFDTAQPLMASGNAIFLMYVCYWALPPVTLVSALWPGVCADAPERRRMVTAAALAQAVLIHAAHRSDYSHLLQALPVGFVLVAWFAGRVPSARVLRQPSAWVARGAAVAVALAVGAAVWGGVRVSGWPSPYAGRGLLKLGEHALARPALIERLAARRPDDARVQAIRYIERCSGPGDRVVTLPPWTGLSYFADRRFAGGQPNWSPGFFSTSADQQRWIDLVQLQHVELVFGDFTRVLDGRDERRFESYSPLIAAYVRAAYVPVGSFGPIMVWVRRGSDDAPPPAELSGAPSCPPRRAERVTVQ